MKKKLHIVAFFGGAGAGKDTAAGHLIEFLKKEGLTSQKVSFAKALKDEVNLMLKLKRELLADHQISDAMSVDKSAIYEISGLLETCKNQDSTSRTPEMRRLLQYWGTDVRRKSNDEYWIEQLRDNLDSLKVDVAIVTDARFGNELGFIVDEDGIIYDLNVPLEIRKQRIFERDGFVPDDSVFEHPSERESFVWAENNPNLIIKGAGDSHLAAKEVFDLIKERK